MKDILISVLVPIYNVEKYLAECLESIINQTYRHLEIICVNDGSTDRSLEIALSFAQSDSRICVYDKDNSGYGATMNKALNMAKGEYIAIVESDDYIDDNMLENLLRYALESKVDIVKTNYYLHTEEGDTLGELFHNPPFDEVFRLSEKSPEILMGGGNIWSGLYRKSFLDENGISFNETPGASYQDTGFKLKTFACADSILLKSDAYYHYRVDNAMASVKSKEKVYCLCDEMEDVRSFLNMRPNKGGVANYWIEPFKYYIYKWNYDRILEKYRKNFLKQAIYEFCTDCDQGYLREQDFRPEWWNELQWYLKIGVNRNTYIFGAGKYGKKCQQKLDDLHISASGFCDNDPKKIGSVIYGLSVDSPEHIIQNDPDAFFLILDCPYQHEATEQLDMIGARYTVLSM